MPSRMCNRTSTNNQIIKYPHYLQSLQHNLLGEYNNKSKNKEQGLFIVISSMRLVEPCVQVIVDEPTLHALVTYIVRALSVCSKWTHAEVLLALSTVLYGNGPQSHKVHLHVGRQ